jgi:hypothetical protein
MDYVIESKSEEGYWSNQDGWGALESASRFVMSDMIHYPITRGNDAILTTVAHAENNRVDLNWSV